MSATPTATHAPAALFRHRPARAAQALRALTARWSLRGVPRLLTQTSRWLLGRERALFRLADGTALVLDPKDYFECMMYYGRFCPETMQVLRRFVSPGDVVLDIGGHVGYFATQLARSVT